MSERIGAHGGHPAPAGQDDGHGRYARRGRRQGGPARAGAAV